MKNFLAVIAVALFLTACAAPKTLYDWGDYEQTLFIHYHEPALKEESLRNYITFVENAGTPEYPLAPGLYAEAGTFMLENGEADAAVSFYKMEYDAWPESRPMLSILIDNLGGQADE